jgi:hypothetical protein
MLKTQAVKLYELGSGPIHCLLTSAVLYVGTLMHTRDALNCSALLVGDACMTQLKHDINSIIEFACF